MSRRHRIRKRAAASNQWDSSPEGVARWKRNLNEAAIATLRYIANDQRETQERREGAGVALASMGVTA